jgi:2-oxoglutarate dehydrogenase E2 component (dihydrolipoamide succinyltransferase)
MSEQIEILMPSMGEGINEATLVRWLKKKGDSIKKDEPLLEVSTDKVDTEIPSPAAGFLLELLAVEGDAIPVNATIAWVGSDKDSVVSDKSGAAKSGAAKSGAAKPAAASATAGATISGPSQSAKSAAPAEKSTATAVRVQARPTAVVNSGPIKSSPLVRKIAESNSVDLSYVAGSGLLGRITKTDIEAFIKQGPAPAGHSSQPAAFSGPLHLEHGYLEIKKTDGLETLEGVPVRREKMSKMRSLIAEHMVRSVRTSPHVTTVFEIDLHRVVQAREKNRAAFQEKEGFNLSFTPFFVWAAVQAIKEHPVVNVSVDGEDILWKDDINMGVAVALEKGLLVPVIKKAGELNFVGIARRMNDLVVRARTKKLTPDDVQGGTFSITNPGMFGSIVSSPIINQPQVAIMSIGAIIKRPVVIEDMIAVRPLVQIGLTFDHRVVDGEGGARYLSALKNHLETFDEPTF